MVRVLKRTMVLDILVLPPTLGHFEVAKVVDDLYCEDFVVKSVQFMPGKRLHVIFDGPEAKNAAEQLKQATIHGVSYRVVESNPQVQLVNVYHYPYEQDNSPLVAVLSGYGEVWDIRYQRCISSASLSTGNRLVRMVRKKHIPRSLNVARYAIKTWYAGQPTECDIYHVAKNCPFRGKCCKCMQEGHVARDCTNPPNVWGTTAANSASDASSDVSGMAASAAEEVPASSSAPSSSSASQVDLQNSECVSASKDLRHSSTISTQQIFSSYGGTAGCEILAPSGSDDVVDHESCGPTRAKVNDVNDKSSRSNSTSATRVLDHDAGDASTQPSCDSINSDDTTCWDIV